MGRKRKRGGNPCYTLVTGKSKMRGTWQKDPIHIIKSISYTRYKESMPTESSGEKRGRECAKLKGGKN